MTDWDPLLEDLALRRAAGAAMGGAERLARQHEGGRLDARARVARLLDPDTFREIGVQAGSVGRGMTPVAPADGLVAGHGDVDGRPVLVGAEDFTVMGGSIGIAQAALDVAVAYALERRQFDRPIGSFQALKHVMADMAVRTNLARSATWAAAAVLDDPAVGDPARSVAAAKLLAGEAAVENARAAIQVMGGMGFTWEMPPHFLLKRALVLDQTFGTPTSQALSLAAELEREVA
jgi:alkylation response protein AidB-like acyl-CoA dehydrogenase